MSTTAVRRLSDVRMTDSQEVGGKAANLGELLAAGVRVPDGVVLTTEAGTLTADERQSLVRGALEGLGIGPFAVRSSGVNEDGAEQSFAGMFESVLDVSADELPAAIDRTLTSAGAARAAAYEPTVGGRMAVIIQNMITPAAAGVALTADPISGDRRSCVVTSVRGTGDRLVSGAAIGDEWLIRDDVATPRRQPERAIGANQALGVAREARRIAAARGAPQDVEWAIDADGALWFVQTRPMTALPPDVSWDSSAPGAYTRAIRFGEWISEPVTPLFESWLLTTMEERLNARLTEWIGQAAPRPFHVVVNGWYFYSINFLSGPAVVRNLPRMLWRLLRSPRRVVGLIPPLTRYSVPVYEHEWREDLLPRYRAAVAAAESRVEALPVADLPAMIDELADLAGDYFGSMVAVAGSAYKLEINLAGFYRRHLAGSLGGSHLPLVSAFEPPPDPDRHAVVSLDWWHAALPPGAKATRPAADHARLVQARLAAEAAALEALASSPRRQRAFRRMLEDAQHMVLVREEQVRDLTIAWPVMRLAVRRIGEALVAGGAITCPDDVFLLTHAEVLEGLETLAAGRAPAMADVASRRAERKEHARLVPPILVGRVNRVLKAMWDGYPRLVGAEQSDRALVWGTPASPGRATGTVRVIRGPEQFDELQPGEILVAPLTAPAWTPLFTRAAAVVTDVGSAAAHASIIAREYGIPAVVGCGDATARLQTGMRVTVDGGTGNVEPA